MGTETNSTQANDYAVAKLMNQQVYKTYVIVSLGDAAGLSEYHEIPQLNRAYVLLVNELQKLYARNPDLMAIRPEPMWKRYDVLKNFSAEISNYISDGDSWDLEHNARVERLCIVADAEEPDLTPRQQKLIDDLARCTTEYGEKAKKKLEDADDNRKIASYFIDYKLDGTILINDVLKLKKAHAGSATEKLLEQALKNPNTLFMPNIGQTSRNLSTVLSSVGFTKELRQLFFPMVSDSKGIIFRPIISRQQADEEKIDTSKLDIRLIDLGAEPHC